MGHINYGRIDDSTCREIDNRDLKIGYKYLILIRVMLNSDLVKYLKGNYRSNRSQAQG